MKRIDVLKGIEQILVQKAYETGHISHRADGDWQKQTDGSWKPYKGQSAQNPNKKDRYGFSLLPDEDKQGYLDRANGDPYQAQILYEKDVENSPMGGLDEEEDQYDEITEEDLEEDSNDWEEEDTEGYYGNSGGLRSTIYEGAYDTQISNIGNTEEDDYGNSVPNDEAVENVVRGIMQEWTGDTDDEDAVEAVHDSLKDAVLDRWSSIYVQKSAVRDMRSTPTTKNMGF